GPEIDYMVSDRRDFAGSYLLPTTMDPGRWKADPAGATGALPIVFRHEMSLFAHVQQAPLSIAVQQTLVPAAHPLHGAAGIKHLGWTREVTLRRTPADTGAAACQAWVLIQAQAGGTVIVPGAS